MTRDPQVEVQLRSVVDGLVNHTGGAIPRDELAALVDDLYDQMAATAKVQTFLPVLVGREALARVQQGLPAAQEALRDQPEVLIVCEENAGRSQAAAALFRHYAPGRAFVESAGLTPADRVLPSVVEALAAHGVHLIDEAKALQPQMLQRASHIIVIGDADLDGIRWDLPALEGATPADVSAALVDIDLRVRQALQEWFPDVELGEPVMQGAADPV
jgi:protein-tyrosine-phosphatase